MRFRNASLDYLPKCLHGHCISHVKMVCVSRLPQKNFCSLVGPPSACWKRRREEEGWGGEGRGGSKTVPTGGTEALPPGERGRGRKKGVQL